MRFRTVAVALLVVVAVVGLTCYGAWRVLMPAALKPLPPPRECVARAGGTAALEPEQMASAATIAAVGVRRHLPVRAVQVALATAMQESKLLNLSGGDRDSVGLFQQRPSQGWGNPQQLMDERFASAAFYAALVKVPDWQTMDVGDAAQAVQHSAYPEAYAQWSDRADVLARALTGGAEQAVTCTLGSGSGAGPAPRGAAAAQAVVAGLRADWGADAAVTGSDGGEVTVRAADAQTGWRYAYWMVSHAAECGVEQVRVAGRTWTVKDGRWTGSSASPGAAADAVTVTARVTRGS
ncbi:hypothetical protein HC031_12205 [Planosporangium thailandense]|uniref:Heavy metal transporter n=1 Tax=Planosporangium thailandense TaxID=765197 RepID=A0ABX0XWN5_9ACTN|nr:hypothetical protein [Planosporangium thailandense]NJC70468.1 hypothetical protein [Planosporangium thailandense]